MTRSLTCLAGPLGLLLLLLLACPNPASTQVIGIDFGSTWFKVASIKATTHIDPNKKPSKELDLVLNRESKRKTLSLITLRDNYNRFFGSDAAALAPRFPTTTFPHLKSLLGKLANSSDAQLYSQLFPVKLSEHPDRGTVVLHGLADDHQFSVEELVAMVLAHAKSQADEYLQKSVVDTVITIPPFFNQAERQSMLTAAKLAGLNVLGLLHDETAVAINYAMTRQFPDPRHHIFYDMGSGSTVASLVRFETERRATKITVLAVGFDKTLGGICIDAMIAEYLGAAFTESNKAKLKTSLKSNHRASAKLLKEAARIKEILSVNANVQAGIEELHEELNLRVTLTRAQLDEMIQGLESRAVAPLRSVISAVPADQIQSLVLVGGGVRVPQIQKWIESEIASTPIKIAKNINADEAAVMGATWRAVVLARSFRIQKNIQVQDGLPYTISIGAKKPAPLFPTLAPMVGYVPTSRGVSKTVTLKKKVPLELPLTAGLESELVATLYTRNLNDSIVDQKLTFQLDTNGVVTLTNSTGTVLTPGSGGLLGIGKTEDVVETVGIEAELVYAQPPISEDVVKTFQARLDAYDAYERMSRMLETERNTLQSLVYTTRDKVSDAELTKVATQHELDQVLEKSQEIGHWLDEADDASVKLEDLQAKRKQLETHLDAVVGRLVQVRQLVVQVRDHAKEMNETTGWVDEYVVRETYDVDEIKTYAQELEARVTEKRRVEAELRRKKIAEQRKIEDELRRKREADELVRMASEEMKKKEKAKNATEPLVVVEPEKPGVDDSKQEKVPGRENEVPVDSEGALDHDSLVKDGEPVIKEDPIKDESREEL